MAKNRSMPHPRPEPAPEGHPAKRYRSESNEEHAARKAKIRAAARKAKKQADRENLARTAKDVGKEVATDAAIGAATGGIGLIGRAAIKGGAKLARAGRKAAAAKAASKLKAKVRKKTTPDFASLKPIKAMPKKTAPKFSSTKRKAKITAHEKKLQSFRDNPNYTETKPGVFKYDLKSDEANLNFLRRESLDAGDHQKRTDILTKIDPKTGHRRYEQVDGIWRKRVPDGTYNPVRKSSRRSASKVQKAKDSKRERRFDNKGAKVSTRHKERTGVTSRARKAAIKLKRKTKALAKKKREQQAFLSKRPGEPAKSVSVTTKLKRIANPKPAPGTVDLLRPKGKTYRKTHEFKALAKKKKAEAVADFDKSTAHWRSVTRARAKARAKETGETVEEAARAMKEKFDKLYDKKGNRK